MRAPTIIKLGGNVFHGEGLGVLAADVAALALDRPIVVVHGGGPQTSELQQRLGQTPRQVAGRRITDEGTLDALKMVVGGRLNIDLCARLLAAGAQPVGLTGASSLAIEAAKRPPRPYAGHPEPVDLERVGDVTRVNHALIALLLGNGYTPVLACLGAARDGTIYNINADAVANRVAVELEAETLVLVSDTRGVLRDINDPDSRLGRMTESEAREAIEAGAVSGGMIAKLEEAFEAIAAGVGRIHVVGLLEPGELEAELDNPGSVGTALVP